MSPDPYDGSYDPSNPQSFNRYTYAMNNPVSYVDPSGLDACVYKNGDGTSTIINAEDGGVVACFGGTYITTTQQVLAVGWNANGSLGIYGAGDGLYNPNGTSYNASQTVTVNGDDSSSYMGPTQFYSPSVQIVMQAPSGSGSGDPNNDPDAAKIKALANIINRNAGAMNSPCFVPGFYAASAVSAYAVAAGGATAGGAETAAAITPSLTQTAGAVWAGVIAKVSGAWDYISAKATSAINRVCATP
jgi:hypothetical protein